MSATILKTRQFAEKVKDLDDSREGREELDRFIYFEESLNGILGKLNEIVVSWELLEHNLNILLSTASYLEKVESREKSKLSRLILTRILLNRSGQLSGEKTFTAFWIRLEANFSRSGKQSLKVFSIQQNKKFSTFKLFLNQDNKPI